MSRLLNANGRASRMLIFRVSLTVSAMEYPSRSEEMVSNASCENCLLTRRYLRTCWSESTNSNTARHMSIDSVGRRVRGAAASPASASIGGGGSICV